MLKKESKSSSFKKVKTYYIHDNGGRPFKVEATNKNIKIYKAKYDDSGENPPTYEKNVKTISSYDGLFVGTHNDGSFKGNSLLVHVKNNKYIFIGQEVLEFTAHEPITYYASEVGNSDVPYPYAVSKNNIYLMLDAPAKQGEKKKYYYIEKKNFTGNMSDVYRYFYDIYKKKENPFNQFKVKTLVKRNL